MKRAFAPITRAMAIAIALATLLSTALWADETFPKPGWVEKPNPLASPRAAAGGEFVIYAGQYPGSLNYLLETSSTNASIFGEMFESLLSADPITIEETPNLAAKWTISDDKQTFTFSIDPRARWSDGKPVTAQDVKWTFDTIMDPKNQTGPFKVELGSFDKVEVVDAATVRFHAKEVHWACLTKAGGMIVLPRHAFEGKDFNLVNFEFPVVSGLYKLGEVKSGISVSLVRRDDWWGRDRPVAKGIGNFKTLKFRFYADAENAFEGFKKGEVDYYPVYTSRIWIQQTKGEPFDKNWIVKQKVTTHEPIRLQGWAMNMRRPPFDDVRVRQAMAYLLNRERMNETLMYNQYSMHKAYFENLWDADHPCPRKPLPFDKEAGRRLLKEAGWVANPATGLLEKGGKPFKFRFLERDPAFQKFLAIYAEDLKDVGIEMTVEMKDWASWIKDMDSFNFDMTTCAWGSGLRIDPEPMWSTKAGKEPGGNNYGGLSDPRVDKIIEEQKPIFDIAKRNEMFRDLDGILYDLHPYALAWYANYTRLLYWNKFGTPPTVLTKFGSEEGAYDLWWYDEDAAADLQDARAAGRALPVREYDLQFDAKFKAPATGAPTETKP